MSLSAPVSSPPPPTGFRAIGQQVIIWPQAKVINRERISVGNRVIIDDFAFIIGGLDTHIGSFVHIGAFSYIAGGGRCFIEDFAGISSGVKIFSGNEQYGGQCMTNPTVPFPFRVPIRGDVTIRKHAIVGANSVILPNVVIGEGAVVGACCLVKEDCEPWAVYFGCPAKKIGVRPSAVILEYEKRLKAHFYTVGGQFRPAENDF